MACHFCVQVQIDSPQLQCGPQPTEPERMRFKGEQKREDSHDVAVLESTYGEYSKQEASCRPGRAIGYGLGVRELRV